MAMNKVFAFALMATMATTGFANATGPDNAPSSPATTPDLSIIEEFTFPPYAIGENSCYIPEPEEDQSKPAGPLFLS